MKLSLCENENLALASYVSEMSVRISILKNIRMDTHFLPVKFYNRMETKLNGINGTAYLAI